VLQRNSELELNKLVSFNRKYLVHDGGDDNKGGGGGGGSSSCLIIRRPKELPIKNKMNNKSGASN
jgi:hypothetical protein